MPIHDQSYRHYAGTKERPGRAWTVIASTGIRSMLQKKLFLGLLLLSVIQLVVRAVMFYFALRFPQGESILGPSSSVFRNFLDIQSVFSFFVTIYVGAGLIAADRRANALQIYLSKPLMRTEYIAGKLTILVVFLMLVTWVPAILLLITQVVLAGSFTFVRANLFLFPAITLACLIDVFLRAFTMLALSSLSKSARFVAIMYAGLIFFSKSMFGVLMLITGGTRVAWVSFGDNLTQVIDVIFRMKPRYDVPWAVSLLVIIGLIAVSMSVLERRVRGVEVVT